MSKINKATLLKAMSKWGIHSQLNMAIEECTELNLALLKHFRSPSAETIANVESEIADVIIMLEQLKLIFDQTKINEQIDYKMARLEMRLNK